ncbi:MAG: RHS repeat-associated core domain-containing protein [Pseudomonadota bacterium]
MPNDGEIEEGGNQSITTRGGGTSTSGDQDNAPAGVVVGVGAPEATEAELREDLENELEELDQEISELREAYEAETDPDVRAQIYDQALHAQADARMAAAELSAMDRFGFVGSMEDYIDGNVGRSGFPSQGVLSGMTGAERFRAVESAGPRYMAMASGWDILEVGPLDMLPGGPLRRLGRLGRLRRGVSAAQRARARGRVQERINGRRRRRRQRRCRRSGGNPVMLDNGAVMQVDPVFELPGLMPQVIASLYMSDCDVRGPLGWGRTSDIDATLERLDSGGLRYRDGAGFYVDFPQPTPVPGTWAEGDHVRLMEIAAGHDRTFVVREEAVLRHFAKGPDGLWRLEAIENPNGALLRFEREAGGLLRAVETPEGLRLEMENDTDRSLRIGVDLVGIDGARVRVMHYAYDAADNMVLADCPFGDRHEYRYDAGHRRIWFRKNGLYEAHYSFDGQGRCIAEHTNGPHDGNRFEYDAERRITRFVPGGDESAIERHYWHEDGSVFATAMSDGRFRRDYYDEDGNLSIHQDENGHRTQYAYNAMGNLTQVIDPEGRTADFRYTDTGEMEFAIDAAGEAWESSYDEFGNLVGTTDPLGHTTDIKINQMGQPTGICRHDGFIRFLSYSDNHWLTGQLDFDGVETTMLRDGFGRIVEQEVAGQISRYAYPAQDSGTDFWTPNSVQLPNGTEMRTEVDEPRRRLRHLDGEGRPTTYVIDAFGKVEEVIEPGGGHLRFRYDNREELTEVENAAGQVWQFVRDAWGRVVREVDFGGTEIHYELDPAGRIEVAHFADGTRQSWAYDKSGLVLRDETVAPGADPLVTEYEYDDRGLMVKAVTADATLVFERDAAGQVVAEIINDERIEVTLTCCGDRAERRIDDEVVHYGYDPGGRLTQLRIGEHHPLDIGLNDQRYEVSQSSVAGFAMAQKHDAVGVLLEQRVTSLNREGLGRTYGWNRAFEPASVTDGLWGVRRLDHDRNGQVAQVRFGDGAVEAFGYDNDLNLAGSAFVPPGGGQTQAVVAALTAWRNGPDGRVIEARCEDGASHRLVHDAKGRVTERHVIRKGHRAQVWRYVWDARDRLIQAHLPDGTRWSYGYDAFARRLWKQEWRREAETDNAGVARITWVEGRRHDFLWDGDVVARETIEVPQQPPQTVHWYHRPGTHVPLARRAGGHLSYVVTDPLGTPQEILSEDGNLEWAAELSTWGRMRRSWRPDTGTTAAQRTEEDIWALHYTPSTDGSAALALGPPPTDRAYCPIRFAGQWEDVEIGLHYNRYRYYLPETGTYLSGDPLGSAGSWRAHGYVPRPNTETDPLGLRPVQVPYGSTPLSQAVIARRTLDRNFEAGSTNYAAARVCRNGRVVTIVRRNNPGGLHAEENIAGALRPGDRVLELYTERRPCSSCGSLLRNFMGNPRTTYSFPYSSAGRNMLQRTLDGLR